jgi:hypothetical protein
MSSTERLSDYVRIGIGALGRVRGVGDWLERPGRVGIVPSGGTMSRGFPGGSAGEDAGFYWKWNCRAANSYHR